MPPLLLRLFLFTLYTSLWATACSSSTPPTPEDPHPTKQATLINSPPREQSPKEPPAKAPPQENTDTAQIDHFRQQLLEQHDQALIAYEEQDALYARLELDQLLSQPLQTSLYELREMVLQMQVFQGRMIEYHNRSKAQHHPHRHDDDEPTSHQRAIQRAWRAHHEYHRHLSRVADHHLELLKLHIKMGSLSRAHDHRDISRRHHQLAEIHSQIARTCHQIQTLMAKTYQLDLHDEELRDPLENTPEELNAPDLIETI